MIGPLSPEALGQQQQIDDLQAALDRAHKEVRKHKARNDRLADVAIAACRDAVLAHPLDRVPRPAPDRRTKGAEHALWHLTDWQFSKVTPDYSSAVARERVHRFVDKAERITAIQRADHPVRDCTIMFGGDQLEGLFNFPTQPFEIDATLFDQFVGVANLMVEIIRRALAQFEHVTVVSEWGNHGRLGSRRDAVPRHDNADRMAYTLARSILVASGETRLTWEDSAEDIQRVEIGNYRALLIHGDEIGRGGYASRTTIVNHVNRWRSGVYPWAFRDCYIGHWHTHYQESLADGSGAVFGTGSTESSNRYASVGLASSAVPSQRLHFVDPDAGRVAAVYQVWLDS